MSLRAPRIVVAVAAAAALAAVGAPARAQVSIEHTGPDTVSVSLGDRGSIAFRLSNAGAAPVAVRMSATLPDGWRGVMPTVEVEIPARSSAIRVVSFYPSVDAVGIHSLHVDVTGPSGAVDSDVVYVRVPEVRTVEMEVVEAPTWATAGETYEVVARITNRGNAPAQFSISLDSPYGVRAETETREGVLDPGESRPLRVEVSPSRDLRRAIVHSLGIRAVVDTVRTEASARVEILPAPHAPAAAAGGLPAELRLRASADPRAGPPLRLQASGPLRPGSRTRISALLQGPSQSYSMFGEPDIYRLGIRSAGYTLDLGDNPFRLSRLTEPGKQGFGAGGAVELGRFTAGGYAQLDRRSISPDTQYAAFAGVSPSEYVSLRGNWLRTHGDGVRRDVVSAEGSLRLPGWLAVRGELGVRPELGALGSAAELTAHRGPITVSLRHLGVDTAYGGIHAGVSTRSGHVNVNPWGGLYVEGSVQEQATERSVEATRFESTQRSIRVSAGWGSVISLEGHAVERGSVSGPTRAGHAARSVRLRLGIPLGALTVYPSVERGVGEDHRAESAQPFWRAGARSSLRAGPVTLSSNLDYFTGGTLHRSVVEEGITGAATGGVRFGGTDLRISAYGTRYLAPVRRDNIVLDASLGQELPFGHRISARVIRRASDGLFQHDDVLALLDYSIPLRIPTGSSDRGASVAGRVRDGATGAPLPRVIVQVGGRRAATDRSGRVTIRGLEPGVHYIDLDRSTTASGLVPTVPVPMRVELKGGERHAFDLELVPGGSMSVTTTIARASSVSGRGGAGAPEPLQNVVLDFELGEQRIRRESDSRGMIELSGLRPGPWTVTIVRSELPSFHRFDRDSATVEVLAGARTEVTFAAAPVQRRIEIVATADLAERRAGDPGEPPSPPAGASERRTAEAAGADRGRESESSDPRPARPARSTAPIALGEPVQPEPQPQPVRPRTPVDAQERPAPAPTPARPRTGAETPAGFTITVVAGDRSLRSIAALVYGDRDLWPRIFLANRDVVSHPDQLFAGQVLRIPPAGPLTPEERAVARRYPERP